MINRLSKAITGKLLANGAISEEEQELYIYGFFMLLSQLMYLVLVCIFGLLLGCIVESVIFYIVFQFIRRYAGGYHAATEAKCEILSTLSIFACIVLISVSKAYDLRLIQLVISAVSAVFIFIFCPLDTPEKPLSEKEFKHYRKISLLILLCIAIAIVISFCFRIEIVFAPCCESLILEGVLIVSGKIKKVYSKERANSN